MKLYLKVVNQFKKWLQCYLVVWIIKLYKVVYFFKNYKKNIIGKCFGDHYLLVNKRYELLDYNILCVTDTTLAEIEFEKMFSLWGGPIESVIKKNLI